MTAASPLAHYDAPWLWASHREHATRLDAYCCEQLAEHEHDETCAAIDARTRNLVTRLGRAGWLAPCVSLDGKPIDVRTLCISREILARHNALADFAFAMQGLGTGPISLFGSPEQRQRFLPPVAAGQAIAAFAITEAHAGSDVAAMRTRAEPTADGGAFDLHGEKTFISNAGIADHYIVFARVGEDPGTRNLAALVVPADCPGLDASHRIETIAPHPLGTLRFDGCRVPAANLIGHVGDGFRIAMATLEVFRPTVGAAALGMARQALAATLDRVQTRNVLGLPLAEQQITQTKLAEMALAIDSAALLVYRAAWSKDTTPGRQTYASAMAKLGATEAAQRVIDDAVQLFGGLGVVRGTVPERLYREIRALRIYEGTSEIQRLVIARQLLRDAATETT